MKPRLFVLDAVATPEFDGLRMCRAIKRSRRLGRYRIIITSSVVDSGRFAQERLAWTDDGRIAYKLKRPWPDGRTALVMPPVAFLRRLCGIIPTTTS